MGTLSQPARSDERPRTSKTVCLWAAALCCLLGATSGCRRGDRSDGDGVSVSAPGVLATSDRDGVRVRAPLGIEVDVGGDGVSVKAPGVDVRADDAGVRVRAPGVRVTTDERGVAVDAPLVKFRSGQ